MQSATPRQISAIRTLAQKAHMDDDTYRDFLHREASVRSTKLLTVATAGHVIEKLKALSGQPTAAKGAVPGLDSKVARKMQALWIAGWNLGIIKDRTDRAMLSFLERQTGVSHTRFLQHPSEATAAIEALKEWLARAGGVDWPVDQRRDDPDVAGQKRAVIEAQWERIVSLGGAKPLEDLRDVMFKATGCAHWHQMDSRQADEIQRSLGRRLRELVARRLEATNE